MREKNLQGFRMQSPYLPYGCATAETDVAASSVLNVEQKEKQEHHCGRVPADLLTKENFVQNVGRPRRRSKK